MTCGIRLTSYAAIAAIAWHCGAVSAAITCEQLASIAYTTQKLRDHGTSLPTVLAEADKLQASNQFTAAEMDQIKTVVEESFKSIRSPGDVLNACRNKQRR